MDVLIHGYTGRMGTVLSNMAMEGTAGANLVARVSPECICDGVDNCYVSLDRFTGSADVVIDFSNHAATETLVNYCVSRGFALVIATTGQTEEELAMIHEAAKKIPVFYSANMSIGVALVADLAKKAAATFPNADIEIIEKHHNQ
ncbi:MAG: 4-hydroxy-tetrahydrodipicolinate reductase, partial [Oscillospiraceae bacterium]|nr:4-hydroxy-tetrahydrodipicolinate reductase [Oscillospiraceae bacterium]